MTAILQTSVPYDALAERALPGIAPLDMQDLVLVDDAYAAQMALRRRLLKNQRDAVLQQSPQAFAATDEVLHVLLDQVAARPDFSRGGARLRCPDGAEIEIDHQNPLLTMGQVFQEDICILQKQGDEHVLTAAVLCFPASWTLAEKFMRPLIGIHTPVPEYTGDIAKRVQRLFDGVRVGRPIWRKNALWYEDPSLFTPHPEAAPRDPVPAASGPYLRTERQAIFRVPETQAVVFSIHTYMLARATVMGANSTS